jgi:hypothetical protein
MSAAKRYSIPVKLQRLSRKKVVVGHCSHNAYKIANPLENKCLNYKTG